jgi:biopolymer transport protein ExbD
MKLESSIRVRPDFLYLAPLLNVVLLLMVFFLLNSNLVVRSGMRVDLPVSGSSVKVSEHAHIVTITSEAQPRVLLNNEEVAVGDLAAKLAELKKESRDVIINADSHAPFGLWVRVCNQVVSAGCYPKVGARAESD